MELGEFEKRGELRRRKMPALKGSDEIVARLDENRG